MINKNLLNLNIQEPEHPILVQALEALNKLNKNFFDNKLNFNQELTIGMGSLPENTLSLYIPNKKTILFQESIPKKEINFSCMHELGHFLDQKMNEVVFKNNNLFYHGVFATHKLQRFLDYGMKPSYGTVWHDLFLEREKVNHSSPEILSRIYETLEILEIITQKMVNKVPLKSWEEKGKNHLNFISKWIKGVKKFNIDADIAKEGWERWKVSHISSFSFIPMMDKSKQEDVEMWRYSWNQLVQSIEDVLFPSTYEKDYLISHTPWTSLIKTLNNNGLTYQTEESELWANGFANHVLKDDNYHNDYISMALLPYKSDVERHEKFWNGMLEYIKETCNLIS
jgi:hypothetical protein